LNLVGNDQVAKYDDGVGTSCFLPLALLGGAFGWGLKRNILDAYKFVCRNYQTDSSDLFLFGFTWNERLGDAEASAAANFPNTKAAAPQSNARAESGPPFGAASRA
jgi:hypothetical protein